jgi:Ca2+-binding EF-hand superfamily protein
MHSLHSVEKWPETKEDRKKLFDAYDPDGNNLLSLKNLQAMMEREKIFKDLDNLQALMRAYKKADEKGSKEYEGLITRKEFVYFLHYIKVYNDIWKKFDVIDSSDDKRIELHEFIKGQSLLGLNLDPEHCKKVFDEIDANKGGYILFDEFCEWVIKKHIVCLDQE